ncbi:hypothetical protein CVR96_28165, partial [Salmonella enterica subsp. enterica serovar Typhimurium]
MSIQATAITADQIQAGTLDASNVNVINLNASEITSGAITGIMFYSPFSYGDTTGELEIGQGQILSQGTDASVG